MHGSTVEAQSKSDVVHVYTVHIHFSMLLLCGLIYRWLSWCLIYMGELNLCSCAQIQGQKLLIPETKRYDDIHILMAYVGNPLC